MEGESENVASLESDVDRVELSDEECDAVSSSETVMLPEYVADLERRCVLLRGI